MDQQPVHVVFGGSGGIGSAVVQNHLRRDRRTLVVSRSGNLPDFAMGQPLATALSCDATLPEQVEAAFEKIQSIGPVASVTHAVGSILLKPAHLTSPEEFAATIQKNLFSSFYVLRNAAKLMMPQGYGRMVFFSSAAAGVGLINHEAIAAAKAGVEGLVRSAAATYAARGLRINAIAPGLVETSLSENLTKSEINRKASLAMHPLGRLGLPQDVASAVDWLLMDDNDWISGQVISVDGGLRNLKGRSS